MDRFPIDYGNKRWDALNGHEVVVYVKGIHRRVAGEDGLEELLLDIVKANTGVLSVAGPLGYEELCLKIAALCGVPGPVEMAHCRPSGDFSDSAPLRADDLAQFSQRHPELFASITQFHQSHTGKIRRMFCIDTTKEGEEYLEARKSYDSALERLGELQRLHAAAARTAGHLRKVKEDAVADFVKRKAANKAAGLGTLKGSKSAIGDQHQPAINEAAAEVTRIGVLVTAQGKTVKALAATVGKKSGEVGKLAQKMTGKSGAHFDLIATAWALLGGRETTVSLTGSQPSYTPSPKHGKAKRIRDNVSTMISRARKTCPVTLARWEEKPEGNGFTVTHAVNRLIEFSREVQDVLSKSGDEVVRRVLADRDDEDGLGICPHVGGAVFSLVGFTVEGEQRLYSFGQTAVGFDSFWQDVCYMKTHTPYTGNAQHALLNRNRASVRAHAAAILHPECIYGSKTKYDFGADPRKAELNKAMRARWGRAVYNAIHEVAAARGVTELICPLEAFAPRK